MQVWIEGDSLLGACDQCAGSIGAPKEDPSDSRLAQTQNTHRVARFRWLVQLLKAGCEGVFIA